MKKSVLMIVLATATVSAISGCGAKTDSKETGSQESGTVTLKVFDAHAYGLEEYAEMVEAFEKDHPGVKIEVQHAANDSRTLLQSRVNSGDIPDVFDIESGTAAQMYYEYAYDWSEDTEVLEKFSEDSLETGKNEEGKILALPWTYENAGLLYNKECFEKAGITELPVNLEELEAACQKLEAAGITPFAISAKDAWVLGQMSTHFILDKSLGAEGTTDALKSGELQFADLPNWNNLFAFLDLVMKYGPDKPLEMDWETSENMLANGQAAIISMGDWCQSTLDSFNPDAQLGFLPAPVGNDIEDTTVLSSCNWIYMVNKDSENLELAKEYMEYILTSDMGQYWMCEGVGAVPAVKTDREVKGRLANDAKVYISEGRTDKWLHTIAPTNFTQTCGAYIQGYMTGDMSAEDVTQYYQEFYTSGN